MVDVVEYFENGQRSAEGRFSAPLHAPLLPIGLHRRFNDRGTLVAEMRYDGKGRLLEERRWDEAGQLLRGDAPAAAESAVPKPASQQ